jgi:hypothetical protein
MEDKSIEGIQVAAFRVADEGGFVHAFILSLDVVYFSKR